MQDQQSSGGSSSILDKIITSKEDKAKQEFNPHEVISSLLKKLSTKEAEVLKSRFGLNDHEKETLEAVGQRYQVTRERIRQIENFAISKIKEDAQFPELIKPVEQVLNSVLNDHGGVMSEEFLLEQLFVSAHQTPSNTKAVLFILSKLLTEQFIKVSPSKKYNLSWRSKVSSMDFLDRTVEQLVEIIKDENQPMQIEALLQAIKSTDYYQENTERLDEKVITAYLEVAIVVDRNPFSEYGLSNWGTVKPKRMNDKIRLLLQKEKKPMHFVDIAKKITQVFKKRAYPPTVHNELILNKEYVLVGRGIYALKEWGYKKGVVADILADILTQADTPMERKILVEKVLEQRIVKKNTIHLALTNRDKFKKLPDGRYTLVTNETSSVNPTETQG